MALYEIQTDKLSPVPTTTFVAEAILERKHLQRLLRADTAPLGEDLLVLAEEFGNWEDSNRRIDLLCLDRDATLVVVEIKRTEDGGHMELQAIRYAAMVSSMTLDQAVAAHAKYLGGDPAESEVKARNAVAEFLNVESIEETELVDEVRIVLVSADFSSEITTSVMWLNKRGLDIRCIRLRPYKMGDKVLVDATQIIPLPEAADYEVKLREQTKETRKLRIQRKELSERHDIRHAWWTMLIARPDATLHAHITPSTYSWIGTSSGVRGVNLNYTITQDDCGAELYIDRGKDAEAENERIFDQLSSAKDQVNAVVPFQIAWERLEDKRACRIRVKVPGGYRSEESEWPDIQSRQVAAMNALTAALQPHIKQLKLGQ